MSTEGHHPIDPHDSFGKMVGLQAALLAVLLSIATVAAHRAHTATIALGSEAGDRWAHYQSKRIREYQLGLNTDLLRLAAGSNPETAKLLAAYANERAQYKDDLAEIKKEAEHNVDEAKRAHHKALYFDLSECILEISLVLSSLYFLSRKKFFPAVSLLAAAIGAVVGALGFLL